MGDVAKDLAAGTVGGAAQLVVGHPFDTIKVKLQSQPTPPPGRPPLYAGAGDAVRQTLAAEGARGLYKGMGAPLATVAAFNAVLFTIRGQMEAVLRSEPGVPLTVGQQVVAGAGAGVAVSFLACPTELIKCRLQAQSALAAAAPAAAAAGAGGAAAATVAAPAVAVKYGGPMEVARHVLRSEGGTRGLFKGLFPTLAREVPGNAIMFGMYEAIKQALAGGQDTSQLGRGSLILAGGLAGASFWGPVYPADVVKSVLQNPNKNRREATRTRTRHKHKSTGDPLPRALVASSPPPLRPRASGSSRPTRMALVTSGSGGGPVIAEVEMNGGADPSATTVRATVVQASTIFYDTPATLDKAERLIAEAAGYGSQLIVFPEAFIGGYPRGSTFGYGISICIANPKDKGKEAFRRYHAAAIDVPGPEVTRLAAMAGKYKIFLVMGVIEREGYTLYCSVLFFDPLGRYLGKHRKLMPTALERIIWGFGDGSTIPVYDTPLGKIGALICWENKMPLLRTALYGKGIEIYCAPTADSRPVWQASMTHIALEGGCFVLSANQFCRRKDYPAPPEYEFAGLGEEPSADTVVCPGGSVIISPSGEVLAGPNYEGEALITADLDLGEIVRAKFDFDVVGHYARPEVLSLVVNDQPQLPVSFTSSADKASDVKSDNITKSY